jgi:hypothetical protein
VDDSWERVGESGRGRRGWEGRFFERAKDFEVDNRCEEQAQTSRYTAEEARSGVARRQLPASQEQDSHPAARDG